MAAAISSIDNNDSQYYDLLEDLLDYEDVEFSESECSNIQDATDLKEVEQNQTKKSVFNGERMDKGFMIRKKKKEDMDIGELDIEEGEILENNIDPTEITSMFTCDKTLEKAFHDQFRGRHLILKIYENCFLCPYCKLNLKK